MLINKFSFREGKIAKLCKTTVSKNLIRDIYKLDLKISNIKFFKIDSKKEFNVSADAGLFIADFGSKRENYCYVASFYKPKLIINKFGWYEKNFVSNVDNYKNFKFIDGTSSFEWRQGIKHDAIKIFVLKKKKKEHI